MDIHIDARSSVPPFEQLRSQIATLVAEGVLPTGSRLETVRHVATQTGLAVNTVARAYRELESDGVVVTRGRQGTFVRSPVVDGTSDAGTAARRAAAEYVQVARRLGVTRTEAVRLVEGAWG